MSVRILVVDDNWEHGTAIKRALSFAGFKAEFFHYDTSRLASLPKDGNWRIVFSDLNLSGDGVGGDKDYATVAAVLEAVIPQGNGPFALVSWTTFANEAQGLLEYVQQRAQPHCHPIGFAVVDKEGLIQEAAVAALRDQILAVFSQYPAIKAVLEWEAAVSRALTTVLRRVESLPLEQGNPAFDKRLHQLFTRIGQAEAGEKAMDVADITRPVMNVLGRLLHDETAKIEIVALPAHKDQNFQQFESIKSELNAMLHVDLQPPSTGAIGSLPGLAFLWPGDAAHPPGLPPIGPIAPFVKENFLNGSATEAAMSEMRLVVIDVTPPCDHSQNKVPWRRFVGALLVPSAHKGMVNKATIGDGGVLRRTPPIAFSGADHWAVLNANLIFAVPNRPEAIKLLGEPLFQVREQLLSDVMGWQGRQVSRLGYTYFD